MPPKGLISISLPFFLNQVEGIYKEGHVALRQEKADKIFYMETDLHVKEENPNFYHEDLYSIAHDKLPDFTPVFNNFSLMASTQLPQEISFCINITML